MNCIEPLLRCKDNITAFYPIGLGLYQFPAIFLCMREVNCQEVKDTISTGYHSIVSIIQIIVYYNGLEL